MRADEYELRLSAYEEPVTMSTTMSRDGMAVLSDSRTLQYEQSYPNGRDCGPACSQARFELSFRTQ